MPTGAKSGQLQGRIFPIYRYVGHTNQSEQGFEISRKRITLDFDLAALFEVETKGFNPAVKRNIRPFPTVFMVCFNRQEWKEVKFLASTQVIDIGSITTNWSQFVTSSQRHD